MCNTVNVGLFDIFEPIEIQALRVHPTQQAYLNCFVHSHTYTYASSTCD